MLILKGDSEYDTQFIGQLVNDFLRPKLNLHLVKECGSNHRTSSWFKKLIDTADITAVANKIDSFADANLHD